MGQSKAARIRAEQQAFWEEQLREGVIVLDRGVAPELVASSALPLIEETLVDSRRWTHKPRGRTQAIRRRGIPASLHGVVAAAMWGRLNEEGTLCTLTHESYPGHVLAWSLAHEDSLWLAWTLDNSADKTLTEPNGGANFRRKGLQRFLWSHIFVGQPRFHGFEPPESEELLKALGTTYRPPRWADADAPR